MISQILIATKGRAGKSSTVKNLIEENIVPVLFVEPQERLEYRKAYGSSVKYVELKKDNGGIGFVRQTILDYAREKKMDYYWTLDDDITAMYKIQKGKSIKSTFTECLFSAEEELKKISNLAIGGLEYNQYAWAAKKKLALNSYCEVATFVCVKNTRLANYRQKVNLKEDRDFVLQNLANGFVSARTSWFAFAAPKNGSNQGGLYEVYKSGKEQSQVQLLCEFWPGICEPIVKKDGRPDAKIKWSLFKNVPVFNDPA